MTESSCDSKALRIDRTKVQGAKGYDVFFAKCGRRLKLKKSIFGNVCQLRISGLERHRCYKAYVRAWTSVNGR